MEKPNELAKQDVRPRILADAIVRGQDELVQMGIKAKERAIGEEGLRVHDKGLEVKLVGCT